ncbi:hypothetical protein PIB30_014263 [Stylosanthes scabra]|uniref:Uncharacterized protein n=1 Tax=Stylosanthes scabra TaxID=79078 RepID=A0ABU6Y4W5_9FABA|nr:hypothetical protein [Stylosanthes scabra]
MRRSRLRRSAEDRAGPRVNSFKSEASRHLSLIHLLHSYGSSSSIKPLICYPTTEPPSTLLQPSSSSSCQLVSRRRSHRRFGSDLALCSVLQNRSDRARTGAPFEERSLGTQSTSSPTCLVIVIFVILIRKLSSSNYWENTLATLL